MAGWAEIVALVVGLVGSRGGCIWWYVVGVRKLREGGCLVVGRRSSGVGRGIADQI